MFRVDRTRGMETDLCHRLEIFDHLLPRGLHTAVRDVFRSIGIDIGHDRGEGWTSNRTGCGVDDIGLIVYQIRHQHVCVRYQTARKDTHAHDHSRVVRIGEDLDRARVWNGVDTAQLYIDPTWSNSAPNHRDTCAMEEAYFKQTLAKYCCFALEHLLAFRHCVATPACASNRLISSPHADYPNQNKYVRIHRRN